jgi:hypothetical protein
MPGAILHLGATVMCSHGGQAMPTSPSARVTVSGMAITTIAAPYAVAGCAFVPPAGNGPCITAQWVEGAVQVTSEGQPVAILSGMAICAPTGTPLLPVSSQMKAVAT